MAPESLRQNLHLQGHTIYPAARAAVVNALLSQHSWQNAPVPMEVGEIGGKKPRKGKAKGKGKQKHQPKQQDKDYSEYQCHNCGKQGHISSQCWSKPRKGKGKGKDKTVSSVQVSTSASSASELDSVGAHSAPASVIASLSKDNTIQEAMIFDDDAATTGWLFAIESCAKLEHISETSFDTFHEVLVDSGAERCVCPSFWARDAPHEDQLNPCLVSASGEPLDHYGCRRVHLGFAGSAAHLKVAFTVFECSASDSLSGQSVETWAWCHLRPDQSTSSLTRRLDQVCAPHPDVSERQHVRCACSQYVSIVKLHGFKTRECHHGSCNDGRSSSCAE